MPGGPKLAELVFQKIYGRGVRYEVAGDMVVRDEYKGWIPKTPYVIHSLTRITSLGIYKLTRIV